VHWLYVLRCYNGSLYIGETNDLDARVVVHNQGGVPHTATRRPVTLAYSETFETRRLALFTPLRWRRLLIEQGFSKRDCGLTNVYWPI
jgi:predicted GIY-YIG superfamily endonuclease